MEMGILKSAFEGLRRVQYTMYWGWALLALIFVAFILKDTTELAGRRFDSEQPVTWIPFGLLLLVVVSCRILGLIGRKWERRLQFARQCFWRTFIQACGMIFSVLLNEMITQQRLKPSVMVLFCGFAFCQSQFLRLGVRLEFTSTLLSTTLIVVWSKRPISDHFFPVAWGSIAVLMMISLGNYFDGYSPKTRKDAAMGRLSASGVDNVISEMNNLPLKCVHCGSEVFLPVSQPKAKRGKKHKH